MKEKKGRIVDKDEIIVIVKNIERDVIELRLGGLRIRKKDGDVNELEKFMFSIEGGREVDGKMEIGNKGMKEDEGELRKK